MTQEIRNYGWIKDNHDPRDFKFKMVHSGTQVVFPDEVSLRSKFKEVPYDQGTLGSCSAQAATAIFTFEHGGGPWSRLALYYYERLLEGTVNEDSGAMLRDAIKVLANTGIGSEASWPYDITKFKDQPPAVELTEASSNKIITYSRLENANDYRQCLVDGYPFMIGIQIYKSFESEYTAETGIVEVPKPNEAMLGGHAVTVVGYNDHYINDESYYEVRNSWGELWGDSGYFWIPAEYIENPELASDAWTIRA